MTLPKLVEDPAKEPFAGILYSIPGAGKTRLAAASTAVFGPAVYFPLDHRGMESIMPKHLKDLRVVKFTDPSWVNRMNEIAIHPWKKDYPDATTLIVDTLTTGAKGMLQEAANKAWFRGKEGDGHIQFGPKDAAITQKIPSISDYGGAKWLVENWLEILFRTQVGMHIIILCHEDLDIPKKEEVHALTVGGPATFGRKLLTELPAWFPTIVRLKVEDQTGLDGKPRSRYTAVSAMQGAYIARVREGLDGGNPMPVVVLDPDGENFWRKYVASFMPWIREGVVAA